jgi:DNA-binding GntR family transcriptional regulator
MGDGPQDRMSDTANNESGKGSGVKDVAGLDEWSPRLRKAQTYQRILVDIIVGALKPGAHLDENELAQRYDGGLAGVREALARLALEGLVLRRARVGTTVAPLDLVAARDAFEARCLIEVQCAGLAATKASPAQIEAIGATLDGGEAAVRNNDVRALAAMDEAFHVAVAAASGNRTLAKMVVTLHHQTARYWLYAMRVPSLAESFKALDAHRALVDVIARGDGARARAVMLDVLGDFPDEMKRTLEAAP